MGVGEQRLVGCLGCPFLQRFHRGLLLSLLSSFSPPFYRLTGPFFLPAKWRLLPMLLHVPGSRASGLPIGCLMAFFSWQKRNDGKLIWPCKWRREVMGLCSQMGRVMSEGQYGKREKGRGEVRWWEVWSVMHEGGRQCKWGKKGRICVWLLGF